MTGGIDPYADPFAEDIHDPVVFALNGAAQLHERAQRARQKLGVVLVGPRALNVLAISARELLSEPLASLAEADLTARIRAGKLRDLSGAELDAGASAWGTAHAEAFRLLKEVERLGSLLTTPDVGSVEAPEPPLPPLMDWATVATHVQADIASGAASVRGKTGQLLIAKPSAGTGKTRSMIATALHEQSQGQRVVMAVRTKGMLVGELEPRVRTAGPKARLHVIQGRDTTTCWNFDNVKAVQAHGYSPGSTVCSRCDYFPDVARGLRTFLVCPYYRSRQNAQNDTVSARSGMSDYPLILTTHSGYLTAVESGGGRFGKFWPCDLLMIDEDPTDAFEPEVVVNAEHLVLPTPPKPEHRAAYAMATLLQGAITQADAERKAMEATNWVANGVPSPVHSRYGSAYAGKALYDLLDRVVGGPVGQQAGLPSAIQILRDVCDMHTQPAAGSLHGATTAAAVSLVAPPRRLSQAGESLYEDIAQRRRLRLIAHKKMRETSESTWDTGTQSDGSLAESEEFDAAYRVRLEYVKVAKGPDGSDLSKKDDATEMWAWRLVFQDFINLDATTNVILGDAYAQVAHCCLLLDKPWRPLGFATLDATGEAVIVSPTVRVDTSFSFATPDGRPLLNIAVANQRSRAHFTINSGAGPADAGRVVCWRENAADASQIDAVRVIDHVARFPAGSLLVRHRTRAGITYLLDQGGWQDHAAILSEVFRAHAGRSVLIYGHRALRKPVMKLLSDNKDFGMLKPRYEHWGSGRGKDEYGDYDAVITISDYIQNVGGMLHKVNARAARETARLIAAGRHDEALEEGTRIVFDMKDPKTDLLHKMSRNDTHWRLKLEHERVNVNELAQALHRVRGLRTPKRMTVVGDGVPFTKDIIAASLVVNLPGGPRGRGSVRSGYVDGSLTVEEAYAAILQIAEHFGVWSPIFLHAFFAMESRLFHGDATFSVTPCQGVTGILYQNSSGVIARDPQVAVPLTLLQRVWFPPPGWKLDNERARNNLQRTKEASARAMRDFPSKSGKKLAIRPTWEDKAHRGYEWCSLGSLQSGWACAADIIENQYGIVRGGVLYAPNQKPFVPF